MPKRCLVGVVTPKGCRLRLLVAVGAIVFAISSIAHANGLRCNQPANVTVYSAAADDALTVCEGAADAIEFLGSHGLNTGQEIEVHVVDKLPEVMSPSAVGAYIRGEGRAYVLSYPQLAKHDNYFELPIDRTLYRSMAAHEVAHAVASGNFVVEKPRIEAQEYIAYVTMISTMPVLYRSKLLDKYPGQGFESEMAINTTTYLFDGQYFGVQAYRHFQSIDGRAFFQKILTGMALNEED
jgi:hypothetical protein